MMNECIFCKIVRGELPCARVYETGETLAFLDIAPIAPGHSLVIPKKHVERIPDLPEALMTPLMLTVRTLARALTAALDADGISLTQANGKCAGQVVPHLHFHLIPRHHDIPMQWHSGRYADEEEMERIAKRIRGVLAS